MEEQRWDRVARLFDELQGLEPAARDAFLSRECADDEPLRRELASMLRVPGDSNFLRTPLTEAMPGGDRLVGAELGGFKILRRLGEGGMGAVYEAQQTNPNRLVALKVMRSAFASKAARRRFEVEAELLGRLHHPNIAQVYESGVHQLEAGFELPYFAMEYVKDARHLKRFADDEQLDVRERIELMLEVCDAISAAHRRGILHRDLKPSNLLVDSERRVRVIDFGVACATADGLQMTRTGELVGTPGFMSPEQLTGRPDEVDVQSDVWALGVVLYQLVSGGLPFDVADVPVSQIAAQLERAPSHVSDQRPQVPCELDWVLERALEHDRARRYGSVSEFADDLRRILTNEPVFAGPASRIYRIKKFTRRNRLLVGAVGATALALIAGTAMATTGLLRARTAETAARNDARIAREEASKFAGVNRVLSTLFTSFDATQTGADARVVDLLDANAATLPLELADQPVVRKALHLVLANSYGSIGEVQRSLDHAEHVLALADEESFGVDDLEAACLGLEAAVRLGQLERARGLLATGREAAAAIGVGAPDLALQIRLGAGRILQAEGELQQAVDVFRGLASDVASSESLKPETGFHVRRAFAQALHEAQEFGESRDVYDALCVEMKVVGNTGLEYELTRLGLANMLLRTNELQAAQELLVQVLPAVSAQTGAASVHTIEAATLLARVHVALKDYEVAQAVLETLLGSVDERDESALRDSLGARQQLSIIKGHLGQSRASIDDLVRIVSISLQLYGADSEHTATARLSLAKQLIRARRYADAETELRESLRVREALGQSSELAAYHCRAALGESLMRLGQPAESFEFLRAAWEGFTELLGPGAESTVMAGSNAVVALSTIGDMQRAVPLAERLYENTLEQLGCGHQGVIAQAVNLGAMYAAVGRAIDGEALLISAIAGARRESGARFPEFADMLLLRGRQLRGRGLLEEALAAFQEAYALRREDPAVNPVIPATMRSEVGQTLALLKRDEEAFEHLLGAHRALSSAVPAESPFMVELVRGVADVLERLGRPSEAAGWRDRLPAAK